MATQKNQQPKQDSKQDAASGAPKVYTVKTVVNHDGEEYPVGSDIELTGKQAAALLAVDAISDPNASGDEAA